MHERVFFNDTVRTLPEALVSATSSSSLFGNGIFTTVAIYDGQPFRWDSHWNRIEHNAATIGIDLTGFDQAKTHAALQELIRSNTVQRGRARITFFDESSSSIWPHASVRRTSLLIMTADPSRSDSELSLTLSPYLINSTSPLAGVKCCNYLEKTMAKYEARSRGFGEAVQLNERGSIVSATMANVFWLKDGKLFTPALSTGCLAGTTREFVLENVECDEVEAGIDVLRDADQIFLTSAGLGVARVGELDGRKLARESHPITELLPPKS